MYIFKKIIDNFQNSGTNHLFIMRQIFEKTFIDFKADFDSIVRSCLHPCKT